MTRLIALFLALATSAGAGDWTAPIGHWTGVGIQGEEQWDMELQVAYHGARVDYPGLDCGGIWVFESGDQSVRGHEWLTYGHAACIDALRVTATPLSDGRLDVRWFTSFGEEIAYAILSPKGAARQGKKSSN